MQWIKYITLRGVLPEHSRSDRRNIVLSNYISIVAAFANLFLLVGRVVYGGDTLPASLVLLPGSILFLSTILLNSLNMTRLSRLVLCWLPGLFLVFGAIRIMKGTAIYESSSYVGLRYILLAVCCFPFLVFNLYPRRIFLLALSVPFLLLIFFDPILNACGVGYLQVGLSETSYYFNNVRAVIALSIITSGFLFLKVLMEKGDALNSKLILDLAAKNKFIHDQAAGKLEVLNSQLQQNLSQLSQREFILSESQRVANIGSWEYYVEGRRIYWSNEMFNIFGLDQSAKVTIETLPSLLLSEADSAVLDDAIASLLQTGKPIDFTVKGKTPSGHLKWLRIYGYPNYESGKILGVRGICHDVTFYKEAEEQIKLSETKYQSLFEQASDGIMILDRDGNFRDANFSVIVMSGYSKEELLRMNFNDLVSPELRVRRPVPFSSLIKGEIYFSDNRLQSKDGRMIEVEANFKALDENQIVAIIRDTTVLREAQRDIQLSEAKFRGAFEDSAIGMALVSLEGNWLKVNKELCFISGYNEDELLNMRFQQLTHPDDVARDVALLNDAIEGRVQTIRLHKRFIHKRGHTVWVNLNVSVIRDNKKALYFVAQMEDITEVKRLDEERELTRYILDERVKELTTLYRASQILSDDHRSAEEAMRQLVVLIPNGLQWTEHCEVQILVGQTTYATNGFRKSVYEQTVTSETSYGLRLQLTAVYLFSGKRIPDASPFLKEEQDLLFMLVEMIRIYFTRKHESEALLSSEANLFATINNTNTLIWSVDRSLKLVTYNKPFEKYMFDHYSVRVFKGASQFATNVTEKNLEWWHSAAKKWEDNYVTALKGEYVEFEDERYGNLFRYSLNPIRSANEVIGVTVFANDITAQKLHEKELAEANKKIGELKLMALRSVMSPHFIFNALNSIQFYIAKNDRLNAIHYLSTFSKLIRSILTHSVDNKIRLTDEVDLLKNYVALEMTRFENKFTFSLTVDPEIETDSISIPSLLIQPFVENAILHGLYNKKEVGKLSISISDEDDCAFIIFVIEDDGVGRAAARKLRSQNFPNHKSVGMQLTQERLQLMAGGKDTAVVVEDLMHMNEPLGTRVTIRIKV